MDSIGNPFEHDCLAEAYDLRQGACSGQARMARSGRFVYPETFGSSGGGNFLRLLERLDSIAPRVERMLELGCGAGAFYDTMRLNGFSQDYVGIDYSFNHIARALRNYPEAKFLVSDCSELPFRDGAFDYVFENNLFQFVLRPLETIREIARVCRGHACFVCHATPIRGGVYCYQPLFAPVSSEQGPDGQPVFSLPEGISPSMRPDRMLPKLMRFRDGKPYSAVVAKVKKHYVNIDTLRNMLKRLGAEIIDSSASPGKYPAVMSPVLAERNSFEAIMAEPDDCRVTEDDALLDIDGMDASFFVRFLGK